MAKKAKKKASAAAKKAAAKAKAAKKSKSQRAKEKRTIARLINLQRKERLKNLKATQKKVQEAQKRAQQREVIERAAASGGLGAFGAFGKTIVFEVNDRKILAPQDVKREISGRWKTHEIVSKRPKMEFLGPDLAETKMKIVLSAEHGVSPRKTLENIEKAVNEGTTDWLVIGGKILGSQKVAITSCSEAWDTIYNQGELVKATVEITLKEAP